MNFGTVAATTQSGQEIRRVVLENEDLLVSILDFGATIERLQWKRHSRSHLEPINLILSYPKTTMYESNPYYCGSIVGRTAGRIANAHYTIDGQTHNLTANWRGQHHLHGGASGFSHRFWRFEETQEGALPRALLVLESADGDEGHPGLLHVQVCYELAGPSLIIRMQARSNKSTHVNLTSHPYFNLSGGLEATIDGHHVSLGATELFETDEDLIATGQRLPMHELRIPNPKNEPIGKIPLDHSFLLPTCDQDTLVSAAEIWHPVSALGCRVRTNQPVLHVYTGDALGSSFVPRAGLCLEAQKPSDACHDPRFGNTLLQPGAVYTHETHFHFYCRKW